MASIATIWVKLGLDSKGYSGGLDEATRKTGKAAQQMGKKLTGIGVGLTAGLTAPIVGAGIAAGKMAVDLQESQNAVNVVFGEAADIMDAYGETVATTAGLSRAEFNQLGAVTGAFLKNVGFDTAQAAEETIKLTERASDMASIFNTDVSQALEAIQSGLKGEFNPLEQFGVKLNAAAISARAMEMGLADANGELSDAAKAQAALALVMEQTDQFAGDFANTSDQLANSTKIAKAEFTDAAAALGTELLPIGLEIVRFLRGLIDRFRELSPEQQKTILIVAGVVAAIGPLVTIIGTLTTVVGAVIPVFAAIAGVLIGPVGIAIAAIAAAVAGLYFAWRKNFLGIRDTLNAVWTSIKYIFAAFKAAFEGDWYAFGENIRKAWDTMWGLIVDRLSSFGSAIRDGIGHIIDSIKRAFRDVNWGDIGKNIVLGVGNKITEWTGWLRDRAVRAAQAAFDAVKGFLGVGSPSKLFGELGKFSAIGFGQGFENTMAKMQPSMNMAIVGSPSASVGAAIPSGNGEQVSLLRQIASKRELDEGKLARAIRDVILKDAQ